MRDHRPDGFRRRGRPGRRPPVAHEIRGRSRRENHLRGADPALGVVDFRPVSTSSTKWASPASGRDERAGRKLQRDPSTPPGEPDRRLGTLEPLCRRGRQVAAAVRHRADETGRQARGPVADGLRPAGCPRPERDIGLRRRHRCATAGCDAGIDRPDDCRDWSSRSFDPAWGDFDHLPIPGWATSTFGILTVILFQAVMLSIQFSFIVLGGRQGTTFLPCRDYAYFVASFRTIHDPIQYDRRRSHQGVHLRIGVLAAITSSGRLMGVVLGAACRSSGSSTAMARRASANFSSVSRLSVSVGSDHHGFGHNQGEVDGRARVKL